MDHHEMLKQLFDSYLQEHDAFVVGGIKAAAPRARKVLSEFIKVAKEHRKEIQELKNSKENTT
jgi:hypothetical protein